jgi:hypothetical protein
LLGAGLIYALPVVVLISLGYLVSFLPVMLVPWMETNADSFSAGSAFFPLFGMFIGYGVLGVGILLGILIAIIVPAGFGHLVAKDRFSAVFQVNEWWPIFRANFIGFLLAFLILLGISMIGSIIFQILFLTIILYCLIPLVLCAFTMYISLISMTLFAQTYSDGVHMLEE